jgi:hypothetical protein
MKRAHSREVNHTIRLFHHGEAKPDGTVDTLLRRLVRHAPAPDDAGAAVKRKPFGMIF